MLPTAKMDPSQRVRQLWTEFESWAIQQRTRLEQECAGIEEKWRHKSSWTNNKQPSSSNDLQRQKEIRDARERYTTSVRTEWARRLNTHKLRDLDWGFIAEHEQERIEIVMGGDLEDPSPSSLPVAKVPTPPQTQPQRPQQPLPVVTQAPPAPSRPAPAPIQPVAPQLNQPPSAGPSSLSFSSAIRSANTSSSSAYTFVDPSDFTTDDELFEPNSSYVIPTDESEDDSISIANPELWGIHPTHGRSSNRSSQSSSPDYPNTHAFDQPSAFSKPDLHTSSPKRPAPDIDKPAAGKPRVRGPSYIGPKLHDEDDKSEEELDFEKFKMHARITKIWEFHFAAAQADVELAMNIYNERQTKKGTGVKSDDASKIAHHEKRMFRLQAEKEIERKAMVSEERKKRREAIQKRGALREPSKNANIVDPTSANRPWENFYDSETTHIAFDASGRLVHSRDLPEDDCDEPEDDEEEIDEEDEVDEEDFNPALTSRGQFGTLKPSAASKLVPEPADRATPSGWKKKSTLAATSSSWESSSASAPAPLPAVPKPNNPFANSLPSPLAQTQDSPWGNGFSEEPHIPGHFSDDSPTTPTLGSWASWGGGGGKKPAVPSKLAQVVGSTPSPPRSHLEREREDEDLSFDAPASVSTPVSQLNGKKSTLTGAAKKRLSVSQQKANSAPAVPTLAKAEPETKTPTMTARVPDGVANPKDLLHQKWAIHAEEELSSTPRPSLMTGAMKRGLSNGVNPHAQAHDFMPESVLTPRVGMRRLDNSINSMHGGAAMTDNETPWQRHERLQKTVQPKPTASSGSGVFDDDDEETENSIWSRGGMKQQQQVQQPQQPQPKQVQSMARAGPAAKTAPAVLQHQQQQLQEEESIWSQVMKSKVQAQTSVPQPIATVNIAEMEDQARMWEGFKSQKPGLGASKPVNGARNAPRQPLVTKESEIEPEETPWQRMQRMQRLSAMAANVASTAPPPAPPVPSKHSWGPTNDFEGPSRHKPQMSGAFENVDQYWSPQGPAATAGRAPQSAWGPPNPSRGPMKRITNGGTVMIEDVQDEEEAEAWNGRGSTLPADSKHLLDIAVPKPSKPSMMYDNIIGYDEDGEEDEEGYNTGLSSSIPTPSTAPTSPPNEVPSMDDEWFSSVAEGMKNGDWDNIIERARQDDFSSPTAIPIPASKQKPKTTWGIPSLPKASPTTTSQTFDSARLRSALEQVSSTPTASGPSPPRAPGAKASPPVPPPKVAAKAPVAPEPKETPAAKTAPPPPAAAAKGKAKKGKGRK